MTTALACPKCGSTRLRSDEVASIGYPINLFRAANGAVEVKYTGESYQTFDEGTVYVADLWCRDCGHQMDEADVVPLVDDAEPTAGPPADSVVRFPDAYDRVVFRTIDREHGIYEVVNRGGTLNPALQLGARIQVNTDATPWEVWPDEGHAPCSDPGCREHGIAASNRRQSEFYAANDRTVDARPDEAECRDCGRQIEVVGPDGPWLADHELAGPGSELCNGSGSSVDEED